MVPRAAPWAFVARPVGAGIRPNVLLGEPVRSPHGIGRGLPDGRPFVAPSSVPGRFVRLGRLPDRVPACLPYHSPCLRPASSCPKIFSKAAAILKEKNISLEGPKPTEHGAVFASRVHTKFMIFLTEM